MKNKIFSILLSLAMVITMMPATSLTAWATESSEKTGSSVASVDCNGTVTYHDNISEAVTKANGSNVDCEIKILKDCSCDGGIVLNNTNSKVITFNTGDEGTELTIKATEANKTLIDVKSSVNFTGNGGTYVVDGNNLDGVAGIYVNAAVTVKMYDGFIMKITKAFLVRGFALNSGATGYFYGGKILCPKGDETDANDALSTIVVMGTSTNLYIYGGEYHWDVTGTSGYNFWAGVTDCSDSSNIHIYDGYFDGPLWWAGSPGYQIFGGKYTTNKFKNDANQKSGTLDWTSYIGAERSANAISKNYNGTIYNFEIKADDIKVVNINTGQTYGSIADGISAVLNNQTLRMLKDLQEDVSASAGKTFSLDLNGYVLTGSGNDSVITVMGNLTILDSNPDKKHNGYIDSSGLWHLGTGSGTPKNISGGIITGGNFPGFNGHGAGILIIGGTLTMNGGTIAGNTSTSSGGGVCVGNSGDHNYTATSTFTMNDGAIIGNTSTEWGGGVCVGSGNQSSSEFIMNDGAITNNISQDGGGVHVGGSGGYNKFTMKDGTISNNEASSANETNGGAGVSVFFYNNGTIYSFVMNGGCITGNTATGSCIGGGVYAHADSGDHGTITLGKTAKITGNTNGSTTDNVHLTNRMIITLGTGSDAPTSGMNVGVTTETVPTTSSPVAISNVDNNDYHTYFFADRSAPERVVYNTTDKKLYLAIPQIAVTKNDGHSNPQAGTAISDSGFFEISSQGFLTPPTLKVEWTTNGGTTWSETPPAVGLVVTSAGAVTTTEDTPAGTYTFRISNGETGSDLVASAPMTLKVEGESEPTPGPTPDPEPTPEDKSVFVELLTAKTSGDKAIKLSWSVTDNASKYVIYGAMCGSKYKKLITTTNKSYIVKKIAGKKLKSHTAYKFYAISYDILGNKVQSKPIHFITANTYGKYANVKSIKAKYDELLLSVGITQKIGATYKMYSGKKHLSKAHGEVLRYISNNNDVVTVSKTGIVKAVGKGTATIFIQDTGGKYCKTKVTVE